MDLYKIVIASDHAGYLLKDKVLHHLQAAGHKVTDLGTNSDKTVDYPDYADYVCENILDETSQLGILICSTGIGMSIAANRHSGIRAALATSPFMAERARLHNDANILVLGSKIIDDIVNLEIVDKFLSASFEGGRHIKRLEKIG
ncbi:MAG: ribose 5-phosphate isomerase B [Pseudomonadota bacterium]